MNFLELSKSMTANEALREYFKSIPAKERSKLTSSLMTQFQVSAKTVENWRYSRTNLKPVYRREISRIIGKDIFSKVTD